MEHFPPVGGAQFYSGGSAFDPEKAALLADLEKNLGKLEALHDQLTLTWTSVKDPNYEKYQSSISWILDHVAQDAEGPLELAQNDLATLKKIDPSIDKNGAIADQLTGFHGLLGSVVSAAKNGLDYNVFAGIAPTIQRKSTPIGPPEDYADAAQRELDNPSTTEARRDQLTSFIAAYDRMKASGIYTWIINPDQNEMDLRSALEESNKSVDAFHDELKNIITQVQSWPS